MSDGWETDYRKLFRACYGAAFALYVRDHMREGKGAPDPDDYARFAKEAETIAAEAAERGEFTGGVTG